MSAGLPGAVTAKALLGHPVREPLATGGPGRDGPPPRGPPANPLTPLSPGDPGTPAADRAWQVAQFPAPLAGFVLARIGIPSPSGD